jgi:hypothetical protein
MDVVLWLHDKCFVPSPFEIPTNAFEGSDMTIGWFEGLLSALVDGKGNVRAGVA